MSLINRVAFRYLHGIITQVSVADNDVNLDLDVIALTFVHEMDNLGYLIEKDVYNYIRSLEKDKAGTVCKEILAIAKESVGDHVEHKPMYPNFPQQVINMTEYEWVINALIHYWTWGRWKPETVVEQREILDEMNAKTKISLIKIEDVKAFFFDTILSKTSIPASIVEFVELCLENGWFNEFEGKIIFKETLCRVATFKIKRNESIMELVQTSTDVLRILASLSGSDVELKGKVKIKSLPRAQRRIIVEALEKVINLDDIKRYSRLWIIAFHSLHIGEFKLTRSFQIAQRFRNEKNVVTYDTIVCESIKKGDITTAVDKLSIKPSLLGRSLDKCLRDARDKEIEGKVFAKLLDTIESIDSKVLLQMLGHFRNRHENILDKRVVFTAGLKGKIILVDELAPLEPRIVEKVIRIIEDTLIEKYKVRGLENDILKGKKSIFIAPEVKKVLLPLQLSSITEGKTVLSRGSRVPFDLIPEDSSKNILRIFHYWEGKIIDIHAIFLDEAFTKYSQISYTNLKTSFATHSGDIVNPQNGASEFIDINIKDTIKEGFRYVAMNMNVYLGPSFAKHKTCFAGYMLRESMQDGEIFEPSTVQNKFDLVSDQRTTLVYLFDLQTREVIWIDVKLSSSQLISVTQNHNQVLPVLKAFLSMDKTKVNIPELVDLHARAGKEVNIVPTREEADFIVGLGEGDLNVFNFTEINSKWI